VCSNLKGGFITLFTGLSLFIFTFYFYTFIVTITCTKHPVYIARVVVHNDITPKLITAITIKNDKYYIHVLFHPSNVVLTLHVALARLLILFF